MVVILMFNVFMSFVPRKRIPLVLIIITDLIINANTTVITNQQTNDPGVNLENVKSMKYLGHALNHLRGNKWL